MGRVKGICYGNDAFPHPYTPSNANSFQCTFGSDSTADYVAALHGVDYKNSVELWCQSGTCRNDIGNMHSMGVELIRLYDWDPRNSHQSSSIIAKNLVWACWSVFRIITSDPTKVCQT